MGRLAMPAILLGAVVIVSAVVVSISGRGGAGASDLGPVTGQHAGKVIAWDSRTDRLVLAEGEKGQRLRRITLWTDPQTTVTSPRSGEEDLFGHGTSRGRLTLADLKTGDRVEIEWRRIGRRHIATSVRRLR